MHPSCRHSRVLLVLLIAAIPACGNRSDARSPDGTCGGEPRPQLDCRSEFSYEGHAVEGGFSALGVADLNGKTELKALRELDTETERYVAQSRRLCDEYNKCVIDRETYALRSENLRRRMAKAPELFEQVRDAKDADARRRALAKAYDELVSDSSLTLSFTVSAERPGESGAAAIDDGASLPTGTRVAFSVEVSDAAHVYLFQKPGEGDVRVLFPDPRIPIRNPMSANRPLRIPDGDRFFKLDEHDVGRENVFLVASLEPVSSLDDAVESLRAGKGPTAPVTRLTELERAKPNCRARALELESDAPAGPCARPRGLVLEGAPSAGRSYVIRTEAADTLVAGVFWFQHTP